jgi:hypothetical protein
MSPDAEEIRRFLARVARRLAWLSAAEGAAAGLALAIVLALAGWPNHGAMRTGVAAGFGLAAVGMLIRILMPSPRHAATSALVERRAPEFRNVLITADELIAKRESSTVADDYVTALVWRDAARTIRTIDAARLFPGRRPLALFFTSALIWLVALTRLSTPASASVSRLVRGATGGAPAFDGVDVTIEPPAYTNRPPRTVHDPARIEALAGSRVRLSVRSSANSVSVETVRGATTLAAATNGTFNTDLPAEADGYIALQLPPTNGRPGARRLIGLTVTPDDAPRVRITAPGKDLHLTDAHYTIDLSAEASDDIGLSSLRLRYTKVSGSGERFTFVEGDVPLEVTRRDARSWTAHVRWSLDSLALAPGDMVVYRAVAADHRPGAPPSESDSYIAELAAPGGNAAAGFALDPNEERYAVSQQMVILKTERLLASKATMTAEAYTAAAQDLAAEQRKVRAEFVFMMGGEVADAPDPAASMTELNEQAEAEGESDLAAGRMLNRGRVALLTAIRSMSRASASLTTAGVAPALPYERDALSQLELAFSRTRILLRALTEHERLDLTRRLSGTLTDVTRDVHPSENPAADPRVTAVRGVLAGIASLAGTSRLDGSASAQASWLAERVLQVDPSDRALQTVASVLDSAATALARNNATDARDKLDRAATKLAAALWRDLLNAPAQGSSIIDSRLNGALTDALRSPRGSP